MRIKSGATRVVLLTKTKAVKLGKIKILRFLLRMIVMPFSEYQRKRFRAKYGEKFLDAVINDVFNGIVANRNEYRYYASTADDRVVPTNLSLLWGLVVVQDRGEAVSVQDISGMPLVKLHPGELASPTQFCRFNNGVLLVDYGHPETVAALMESLVG